MSQTDVVQALNSLIKEINDNPDLGRLEQIRSDLDDPVLEFEVLEFRHAHLDPEEKNTCATVLRLFKNKCEDKSNDLGFIKEAIFRTGFPLGVALMVASIVSIFAGAEPQPLYYLILRESHPAMMTL